MDFSNCTLDTTLNTHVPSLRNSNQDECDAWVIPGPISFCSQEQGTGVSAWVIDVFNRAENELDFKINAHVHKKQGV